MINRRIKKKKKITHYFLKINSLANNKKKKILTKFLYTHILINQRQMADDMLLSYNL